MKVIFKDSVLTIKTGLKVKTFNDCVGSAVAKDEKGNEVFRIEQTPANCTCGDITSLCLTCNAVIDNELAVQMVMPRATTLDDIKREYGAALVAAVPYVEAIAKNIKDASDAFAAMVAK